MKRISAIICVAMMVVTMLAPAAFAAEDNNSQSAADNKSGFFIEQSSPEDGAQGIAVENLSVKITFSKEMLPKNAQVRKFNAKQFKLTDQEGHKIPVKVYYSEEEEGLLLVAADAVGKKDAKIKGDVEYTLTISGKLQATDGTTLGEQQTITMKTLNQSRSTAIYMVLMVLMMGGMVFFTIRGTKKEEQKKKEEREVKEGLNPYKEAKKSGKTVEEVVAKQSRKKQKKEEAIRRQKEAEAAIEAEIIEKIRKEKNKRVSSPKSLAAAGSSIKLKVKNDAGKTVEARESLATSNKGTTNPKNRSGKKKNKSKKK